MGHPDPCRVHRSVETYDRIDATTWAQRGLVLIVAVAPLNDGVGRELAKAVVANRHIAGEQSLAVHG